MNLLLFVCTSLPTLAVYNFFKKASNNSLFFHYRVVMIGVCFSAGWSSLAARRAHNPKVVGSNPAPATTYALAVKMGLYALFLYFINGLRI